LPRHSHQASNMDCETSIFTTKGGHHSKIEIGAANSTKKLNTESDGIVVNYQWKCSSNHDHDKYIPMCMIHSLNEETFERHADKLKEGEKAILDNGAAKTKRRNAITEKRLLFSVIHEKTQHLPIIPSNSDMCIASNHVLINNTRAEKCVLPLIRENELDKIATVHAKKMAIRQTCELSNLEHIVKVLGPSPWRTIGENVCRGATLVDVHNKILNNSECSMEKSNITDRRFTAFGVGVATSSKGEVYICQLYKG